MDLKKEQLYKSMKILDLETNSEPINIELIKKMKVEEYIEYQFNRQIELLNKYTEKKIQELQDHKNILKRELMDKNNQQINQLLNSTSSNNNSREIQDQDLSDSGSDYDQEQQQQQQQQQEEEEEGEEEEEEEEFEFDEDYEDGDGYADENEL